MNTAYEKGRAAEYAIKRKLESMGYRFIIRSAASHTPIDLIVSNGDQRIAVQVKGGQHGRINDIEAKELETWANALS